MTEALFLGVDGGGSRCRARLESADGHVLGHGLAGPASLRFGFEAAIEAVMTAVRECLREAGLQEKALGGVYAGIGLAGTGHRGAREKLEAWRHPFASAWFEGDAYLAYLGAFGGDDGGVVIVGTGSIGITYRQSTVRIGGYGFPVSDEGSGADLGLNAIRHALRTLDGREASSAFSREVLARFSDNPTAVLDWLQRATPTDYATFAPLVVHHADEGDTHARKIMEQAGRHIAELIEALYQRGAPRVALINGLAHAIQRYMPAEAVCRLVAPQGDAMAGGILLARRKMRAG